MEPLHARYPFLRVAREAVEAADVDLGAIADDRPVVARAFDRVRNAVEGDTVGDPHRSPRVELLSYPVARVLVSIVDEPGLTRRYARAEATTAHERFTGDIEAGEGGPKLRSVERVGVALDRLLAEFDLADAVSETDDGFAVGVGDYLRLAAGLSGERWRLTRRRLDDGAVAVSREELYALLREAVHGRVAEGLPLDVPDPVVEALSEPVSDLRGRLADHELARDIDAVEEALFPPCVAALVERARGGDGLPPHSRFALTSFLASIGMATEEIVDRAAAAGDGESVGRQVAHLRDETGAVYPPPSCATMQAYGDCVNRDALCARISHPLEYYERRLDGDDAVLEDAGAP